MILTEEQAKARLESGRNLLNRFGVEKTVPTAKVIEIGNSRKGTYEGRLTPEQKTEITSRARLGEDQELLATEFKVQQSTIGKYERGVYKNIDESKVEDRMNEVQDVAMAKLLKSLGFLDDNKLSKLGAKDLSAIAANMSKVVGNTREQKTNDNRVTVQLFAPELRQEKSYKVLEVTSV